MDNISFSQCFAAYYDAMSKQMEGKHSDCCYVLLIAKGFNISNRNYVKDIIVWISDNTMQWPIQLLAIVAASQKRLKKYMMLILHVCKGYEFMKNIVVTGTNITKSGDSDLLGSELKDVDDFRSSANCVGREVIISQQLEKGFQKPWDPDGLQQQLALKLCISSGGECHGLGCQ